MAAYSIKGQGGSTDSDATVRQGRTFYHFLPVSKQTMERNPMVTAKTVASNEGTVLLVDDDPMVRDISTLMLKRLGYAVIAVESGKKALEVYGQSKADVDLIILDMVMPDISGGETFDQLKDMNPEVKVLLSSGNSKDGQATEIINRGCAGFLQKPFSLGSLAANVQRVLDEAHKSS